VHPTIDVGLVVLPKPFRKPDRFMWLQPRSIQRTATLLTLAGYPCDKPFGTMWGHSDRIPVSGVSATHLFYPLDTCPGHSGSPIWLLGNNGIRLLLGVHTGGVNPCDNDPRPGVQCRPTGAPVTPVPGGENCGVRLNCDVITRILAWSRELGAARLPTVDRLFRSACR
jgi:glutamyl endopeptidase